jgi:homoserine O-acetyltransferase
MCFAAFVLFAFLSAMAGSGQTMSSTQPASMPRATKWPVKDSLYVAHDFRFGTGEGLPELKLRYLTLGSPHRNAAGHVDNAVLLLHGTGGNRHTLLNPLFSDVLFGPGQPLDITRYYLIFPDDIGQGDSSKPSDEVSAL